MEHCPSRRVVPLHVWHLVVDHRENVQRVGFSLPDGNTYQAFHHELLISWDREERDRKMEQKTYEDVSKLFSDLIQKNPCDTHLVVIEGSWFRDAVTKYLNSTTLNLRNVVVLNVVKLSNYEARMLKSDNVRKVVNLRVPGIYDDKGFYCSPDSNPSMPLSCAEGVDNVKSVSEYWWQYYNTVLKLRLCATGRLIQFSGTEQRAQRVAAHTQHQRLAAPNQH